MIFREEHFVGLGVNSYVWVHFVFTQAELSRPGSSVGTPTGYGLDGPGIESQWGRDFPHLS